MSAFFPNTVTLQTHVILKTYSNTRAAAYSFFSLSLRTWPRLPGIYVLWVLSCWSASIYFQNIFQTEICGSPSPLGMICEFNEYILFHYLGCLWRYWIAPEPRCWIPLEFQYILLCRQMSSLSASSPSEGHFPTLSFTIHVFSKCLNSSAVRRDSFLLKHMLKSCPKSIFSL